MKGLPFPPSITPSFFLALSSKELQLKDSTANVPPGSIHARDTSPLFLVDYYHRPPLPRSPLCLSRPHLKLPMRALWALTGEGGSPGGHEL